MVSGGGYYDPWYAGRSSFYVGWGWRSPYYSGWYDTWDDPWYYGYYGGYPYYSYYGGYPYYSYYGGIHTITVMLVMVGTVLEQILWLLWWLSLLWL